jgi:hypothetical protein
MSSALLTLAELVTQRFETEVASPHALTVQHDNEPPPSGIPGPGRWCRVALQLGQQQQVTTGQQLRRFRTTGVLLAQLFEPLDTGDGEQLAIVDAIVDAFRNVVLQGPPTIFFHPPYVSASPVREDSWWLCVVAIPFHADEYA